MKLRVVVEKKYTAKQRLNSRISWSVKSRDAKVQAEVDISKPYRAKPEPKP